MGEISKIKLNNTEEIYSIKDSVARESLSYLDENKQEKLISSVNLKTINYLSLLGSGNITIGGSGGGGVMVINTGFGLLGGPITESGEIYVNTDQIQEKLIFDSIPQQGSINPVTSGGVFTEIQSVKDILGEAGNLLDLLNGEVV